MKPVIKPQTMPTQIPIPTSMGPRMAFVCQLPEWKGKNKQTLNQQRLSREPTLFCNNIVMLTIHTLGKYDTETHSKCGNAKYVVETARGHHQCYDPFIFTETLLFEV
jgi:hypothetical protein